MSQSFLIKADFIKLIALKRGATALAISSQSFLIKADFIKKIECGKPDELLCIEEKVAILSNQGRLHKATNRKGE